MFAFLKGRQKTKATPFQIAALLAMTPSKYVAGVEKSVDDLLKSNPQFLCFRNRILDEVQWIIVACGVVTIRILDGMIVSKQVLEQIPEFFSKMHESNNNNTMFTKEYIENLRHKLEAYLVRFNRRLVLDNSEKLPFEALSKMAAKDFANETMKYITGKGRCTEITQDDLYKLQERTETEDELEGYIYRIICQFIPKFAEQIEKFKIVS